MNDAKEEQLPFTVVDQPRPRDVAAGCLQDNRADGEAATQCHAIKSHSNISAQHHSDPISNLHGDAPTRRYLNAAPYDRAST